MSPPAVRNCASKPLSLRMVPSRAPPAASGSDAARGCGARGSRAAGAAAAASSFRYVTSGVNSSSAISNPGMPRDGAPSVMMRANRSGSLAYTIGRIDTARSLPAASPPWQSAQRVRYDSSPSAAASCTVDRKSTATRSGILMVAGMIRQVHYRVVVDRGARQTVHYIAFLRLFRNDAGVTLNDRPSVQWVPGQPPADGI